MPHVETTSLNNNYTFTKILRTGLSPLSAMIGTSAYYGQSLNNPILGSINSLLFAKKLGIDIWSLNQRPSNKIKLLNSSKKILLGLGAISLANFSKFVNYTSEYIIPTTTSNPITSSTTTVNPFPPLLLNTSDNDNNLMDWDTYISLNTFGATNIISAIIELFTNQERLKKVCDIASGSALISAGVSMGINNEFNNAYAIPTIVAGASEIINNLLPMETEHTNIEMQETVFTIAEEESLLNNDNSANYGSQESIDSSLTSDILYERQPVYQTTVEFI